jgi:hypothetical protein
VDGQKTLHAAILRAFSWFSNLGLLLDWYHLEDTCKRQLSLAMKGRTQRNAAVKEVTQLLWYGRVKSAILFLRKLPREDIKNSEEIHVLIGYVERNRPYIPCYEIRKRLGLRNSSNIGEKMNDLLVSHRQKHKGMSWSVNGSSALAALEALKRNDDYQQWFEYHEITLKQAAESLYFDLYRLKYTQTEYEQRLFDKISESEENKGEKENFVVALDLFNLVFLFKNQAI